MSTVLAHCPKCGAGLVAEAVVQRVELLTTTEVETEYTFSGSYVGPPVQRTVPRTAAMVSFESTTVPHQCPSAGHDTHHAYEEDGA